MSRFGIDECEHARVWAALAPDGELSEFERRSLRSHLHTCDSCARFASEVESVALLLREAELDRPTILTAIPRTVRRRQALAARGRPVAAAAAVALMALGIASRAPLEVEKRDSGVSTTTSAVERTELQSLRALRQGAILAADRARLDPMVMPMENQPT
jgi:predicted anti-sigma-YlaC factor YlaD